MVLEPARLGSARRVGVITDLLHVDGTPPYRVRWLDNEHETLYHPGPDCHLEVSSPPG